MKKNKRKKIIKLVILMVTFLMSGSLYSSNLNNKGNAGVCVRAEIREQLSIKLFTPSETLRSTGQSNASITTTLKIEETPVHIQVRFSVPRNQMVQLQVKAHGDLSNEYGDSYPISNVAWRAVGPGFQNGILSKNAPKQVGSWVGPNRVQGTIKYYYTNPPSKKGNYTQLITYSLFVY